MAKKSVKEMEYQQAVAELEEIIRRVESPDVPLSDVSGELKRAMVLVKHCREALKGYEKEFTDLTKEE